MIDWQVSLPWFLGFVLFFLDPEVGALPGVGYTTLCDIINSEYKM